MSDADLNEVTSSGTGRHASGPDDGSVEAVFDGAAPTGPSGGGEALTGYLQETAPEARSPLWRVDPKGAFIPQKGETTPEARSPWWRVWESPRRLWVVAAVFAVLALVAGAGAVFIASQPRPAAMTQSDFENLDEHVVVVSIGGSGVVDEVKWVSPYSGEEQSASDVKLPWSAEVRVPAADWEGVSGVTLSWEGLSSEVHPAITVDGQIVRDDVFDSDGSLSTVNE